MMVQIIGGVSSKLNISESMGEVLWISHEYKCQDWSTTPTNSVGSKQMELVVWELKETGEQN
jgi:hypothetical protein